ncbi:MAG: zinc ABC transporter substrate-binding protein [Pseudomonadota bacterium]
MFLSHLGRPIAMAGLWLGLLGAAAPAAPRVVVDIAPMHAIVARVMAGAGSPSLLLPPGASPHGYALRPSEAATLSEADLVVWTGPALTPWLERPLDRLAENAARLTLMEAPGINHLPLREGPLFEHGHDHGQDHDHDHGEKHDHSHEHEHDEDHGAEAATGHAHTGDRDAHLWLDPANGAAIAAAVAEALAEVDPAEASLYRANAAEAAEEYSALSARLSTMLAPARGQPFVVLHDAYHHFERAFGVEAAGAIAAGDGGEAGGIGPARLAALRERIGTLGAACLFAEPQFPERAVVALIEGTPARAGRLDPLGVALEPGPALYPKLLEDLAEALVDCLG